MDYRFLTEVITQKPGLFRAMLVFNREYAAPEPGELAALGKPFSALWNRQDFRRAWASPAPRPQKGYWNFSEESQRLALLDSGTLEKVGLLFSAAVHAEELSHLIARDSVLEMRQAIGADVFSYALKRGRYQVGSLRGALLVPASLGTLEQRIRMLASVSMAIISSGWPEELRALAASRLPRPGDSSGPEEPFSPELPREQRRALWFTMKKLLLREVAPEWAPCFD